MSEGEDPIAALIGEVVVLDTAGSLVYAGTLKAWHERAVVLTDADVHDTAEGGSGKEMYVLELRRHGVQRNRHEVFVRAEHVVSVSRLEDVVHY